MVDKISTNSISRLIEGQFKMPYSALLTYLLSFWHAYIAGQRGGGEVRMTMITFSRSYVVNDDVILSNNDVNIRAPSYSFAQLWIIWLKIHGDWAT